jgi:hypothetical protein
VETAPLGVLLKLGPWLNNDHRQVTALGSGVGEAEGSSAFGIP